MISLSASMAANTWEATNAPKTAIFSSRTYRERILVDRYYHDNAKHVLNRKP